MHDCVIVGAGPAGLCAGIQLRRAGYNIVVLEKKRVGGLALNANLIENYLGFPKGISGKELVKIFDEQRKKLGVPVLLKEAKEISKNGKYFEIITNKEKFIAKSVLVATGTRAKKANIPVDKDISKKVFYEIADIPKLSPGKKFIIIGGGDAAFDYALNLAGKGHYVEILVKNKVKCLGLLKERVKKHKNTSFCINVEPKKIIKKGSGIEVVCKNKSFIGNYIIIAAGRLPEMPKLNLRSRGLFLTGDVVYGKFRQVHIATGDALLQAMRIVNYLENGKA